MRTVTHLQRQVSDRDGVVVRLRYFTMESELAATRGVCIPQVALRVGTELECVDAEPELVDLICGEATDWRVVLGHLTARYAGEPMGELAERGVALLGLSATSEPAPGLMALTPAARPTDALIRAA